MPNETRRFPATVVRVLSDQEVVINRGTDDGVKNGQRFLIYVLDAEPIVDLETGATLGNLEIIRGTGRVKHAQPAMATLESDKKSPTERRVIKRNTPYYALFSEQETVTAVEETLPFDDPNVGDKAKPL